MVDMREGNGRSFRAELGRDVPFNFARGLDTSVQIKAGANRSLIQCMEYGGRLEPYILPQPPS